MCERQLRSVASRVRIAAYLSELTFSQTLPHCYLNLSLSLLCLDLLCLAPPVCCTWPCFSTAGSLCRAKRWEGHPIQGFGSKQLVTRLATPADAYPVADCHVAVFNPKNFLTPLLIVDRVLALLVCPLPSHVPSPCLPWHVLKTIASGGIDETGLRIPGLY